MSETRDGDIKTLTEIFRRMTLIRRTEEILIEEYHPADQMRCPIHFCVGQEAAPAVLWSLLTEGDVVYSHHRSHGYYLATGAPLEEMVAEFYGKKTGSNGGLAGSQELSHQAYKFYSGTILSGAFALTCGSAFAQSYRSSENISVGVIGDGGMEEGIVFEALNLAAVKSLPIVFLCENNGYSIHTPIPDRSRSSHLIERAKSFGLEAHLLDGNDAVVLLGSFTDIIGRIRSGGGPVFVEVETYRYCGHVGPEGDDHYGYRPESEMAKWKSRDPIPLLAAVLRECGVASEELDEIGAQCADMVHRAIEAAKAADFPSFNEALTFNLSETYSPIVEELIDGMIADFDPAQQETVLRPY